MYWQPGPVPLPSLPSLRDSTTEPHEKMMLEFYPSFHSERSNEQKMLTFNPKCGFACNWKLLIYCQSIKGTHKRESNLISKANN